MTTAKHKVAALGRIQRTAAPAPEVPGLEAHLGLRFREALDVAVRLHGHQVRKVSGTPYISHLLATASIALDNGANEDEAIAALLHDAVEDRLVTLPEIRRRFGEMVARIVDGCTPPDAAGATWRQRKAASLARLRGASTSVHLVKAADALDNARSLLREHRVMGDRIWGHFNGSLPEIQWYYRQLAGLLRSRVPAALAEELEQAVSQIERIARGNGCQRDGSRS